ncbi:MAG: hypothetical protein M3134_00980, partial [Actinomycetota bacterium]|nr:hypothetical protein [Actinomycetota bacterium]
VAWWMPGLAFKAGAALYEAVAVFAVPAALDQGLPLGAARSRSEQLVAERWGPGRFRAVGLPQTSPWSVVYTRGVTSHGYKAPYLAAAVFLAILLGPLLIALAVGDTTWILVAFAWMWGSVALGGLVWAASVQPSVQGVLRAYLYHYAKTGEAVAPFEVEALHACLREEVRARLGLPQRTRRSSLQSDTGLTPEDVRGVIAGAREFYRDGKKVTAALRRAPDGLDATALVAATGLPEARARVTVVNLVWTGKVRAEVTPAGTARFSLVS